ncbi:MAG: undecaprenyl-diphosphate phosphatase [Bacteroidota bacterium]
MQDILRAIIIGIIQGLTEFLPVSSSGHIEIGQALLNLDYAEYEDQFSVVLHAATALSTIIIFRKDITSIFRGLFSMKASDYTSFKFNEDWLFAFKIVLSMIPAAVVGLVFEEQLEVLFNGRILLVGFMLLITGALLFLADRAKRTERKVSFANALVIGIAQAIAILPGISRSGATISTSVLLGIDRERAARFSFLMVVPLILGKMAKDILDGKMDYSSELAIPFIAAFFAAFLTGLLACQWMIKLVKNSKLTYFSIYCFVVGIIAIVVSLMQA